MTEMTRNSNIETSKALDFSKGVGDKSIYRYRMRIGNYNKV